MPLPRIPSNFIHRLNGAVTATCYRPQTMTADIGSIPQLRFSHIVTARRSFTLFAVLAAGLVFVFTAFTIDPARDCVDYACPGWLRWLAFATGGVFAGSAALAMWRKCEWGSFIDPEARQIVWWHGTPPRREKSIPIDLIGVIRVETKWDSDRLILIDSSGRRMAMPAECAPHPLAEWGGSLARQFPHIRFETD